jgi:hypothetical protein
MAITTMNVAATRGRPLVQPVHGVDGQRRAQHRDRDRHGDLGEVAQQPDADAAGQGDDQDAPRPLGGDLDPDRDLVPVAH